MKLNVLNLKPTQLAIGFYEVDQKIIKISRMTVKELNKYLNEKKVPVIKGPENAYYMIDRHHLVRSAWEAGIAEVECELKGDLSHLSWEEFWNTMRSAHWLYLYDNFGNGPHPESLLPVDIRRMADDPYRSLSWLLRENKVYTKSPQPYAEFSWANLLRKHIELDYSEASLKSAYTKAIQLIHDKPELFESLPGFKRLII